MNKLDTLIKDLLTSETEKYTRYRGTNATEYQIYRECANDGTGIDFTTGKPLKTFDEWLNS